MSTIGDLFNPVGATNETKPVSNVYKVSYKNGINGVYKSVVRFVPFWANPSKCIMQKYITYVKNPITQQGMYVDDPRSVGKQSPTGNLYWDLKRTNVASYVDLAQKYLNSRSQYAALVQIVNDPQHPEWNGQIKVFTFGKTIYDKLNLEEHPVTPGQVGINPFDPINGRYFSIYCTKKDTFNNFDNCTFFDAKDNAQNPMPTGIQYLNPESGQMEMAHANMNKQYLVDYLSKNSPDLNEFDYHDWTPAQTAHADAVCAIIRNYMATGQMVDPNTGVAQSSMNTLAGGSPIGQGGVVFPGANGQAPAQPAQPAFGQAPAPQATYGQAPAQPAFSPAPQTAPSPAPAPAPAPAFNPAPSPAPAAASSPAPAPMGGFATPVTPAAPNLTPAAPAPTFEGSAGVQNFDDIINSL